MRESIARGGAARLPEATVLADLTAVQWPASGPARVGALSLLTPRTSAYYSHSYRVEDREINKHFWGLCSEANFAFIVDPRSGRLSIPFVERMIQGSDSFVSVVTERANVPRYLTSPYFIFEYGLAVQANKPRLVFLEDTVARYHFEDSRSVIVFNRESLADDVERHIEAIRQFRRSIAPADPDRHRRGSVGLLLPERGDSADVAPLICQFLDSAGYEAVHMDTETPDSYKLVLEANRHNFVIIDVAQGDVSEWLHAHLMGRVPMIRLARRQRNGQPGRLPSPLLGHAIELVARSDEIAIWWHRKEDLMPQIQREVTRLRQPPRGRFGSRDQGMKYFSSLGRSVDATVFVSNASNENDFARKLCGLLEVNNIQFFHYKYANTIPLGTPWPDELRERLRSSQLFVPIITQSYLDSDVCRQEYEIAQQLSDEGRLLVFPYFLEDVRGGPTVPQQGSSLHELPLEGQLSRIVSDIDAYLTPAAPSPQVGRPWGRDGSGRQVDVAIITVLPEEYEAALRHLDWHTPVNSTPDLHNRYGWQIGEIAPAVGSRPHRVVVGVAGQKGTSAGLMIVSSTVEAFRPSFVLLVGIAGGLGAARVGDVVVSDRVFGYEYGVVSGGFRPRPDWNHPTDIAVVNAAHVLSSSFPDWHETVTGAPPPRLWRPQIHVGPVASGNKVIEDLVDPTFAPVIDYWPKLVAVEMEGLGAVEAIKDARERGYVVSFAMIRGISDRPGRQDSITTGPERTRSSSARDRRRWKRAAADIAALCAVQMIKVAWPQPPGAAHNRPSGS
jgi:nucleoside phosphorylase